MQQTIGLYYANANHKVTNHKASLSIDDKEAHMKRMPRILGVLMLAFTSTLVLAAPGLALKDENMLAQPSATAAEVGKMTKGASVDIVAKQGGWLQIKLGKAQGWVRLLSVRAGTGGAGGSGLADVAGAVTQKSDPSRVVAVAGVRGLNEEDLKGAKYNADEIARLEKYTVSAAQAQAFADKSGLKSQNVAGLPKPKSESQSNTPWGND